MNLLHEQVTHPQFGTGEIAAQTETMLTVQFASEIGQKRFACPAAFGQHLALCNPALQETAAAAAAQAAREAAAATARRVQERAEEAERKAAEEAAQRLTARKTKKPVSRAKPKAKEALEE